MWMDKYINENFIYAQLLVQKNHDKLFLGKNIF